MIFFTNSIIIIRRSPVQVWVPLPLILLVFKALSWDGDIWDQLQPLPFGDTGSARLIEPLADISRARADEVMRALVIFGAV
jgi:hypothetical protein